jgi:hypothetical protein
VHICGKRGGEPFLNVTRPGYLTQKCPYGKVACSENTSLDSTVCYPEADITAMCPINDMFFFDMDTVDSP